MKNEKAKTVAEDHGSELLTVIDAVELADEITKADRPFYIDTDHEVENGLDVLEEIRPLSARVIVNQVSMKMQNERIYDIIEKLRESLRNE